MAIRLVHEDDGDFVEAHEINVTPFIDVILVLLIIFMIAAPLATVDLPTSTAEPRHRPDKPIFLTLKADHSLSVEETATARDALGATLDAVTQGNRDERIFLRADRAVSYGDIMDLMNVLRAAGYLKVALVGLESRDTQ
jgi:biopolymer transport protein ExbD